MSDAGDRAARSGSLVAAAALLFLLALPTRAAPLTAAEIAQTCAGAEDAAHCGRSIETRQLARLPGLAVREGNALVVSLFPAGHATFTDDDDPVAGTSYSLWDYLDAINSVVLYVTAGDSSRFMLLQRATDRRVDLAAAPRVSPDRQRLVVADLCLERCTNEIVVWRISREGFRKELAWHAPERWSDGDASWRDASTIAIEYTAAGTSASRTIERALADPSWTRFPP